MRVFILALLPLAGFSFVLFGPPAVSLTLFSVAGVLIAELIYCVLAEKKISLTDGSALITGLLLAFSLPPAFPPLPAALAGGLALVLVKLLAGGFGQNLLNPALAARLLLHLLYPERIFEWSRPFAYLAAEAGAVTAATPISGLLAGREAISISPLLLGFTPGCIAETSILLIALLGLALILTGCLSWRQPLSVLVGAVITALVLTAFAISTIGFFHHLFSGGLFLGAFFYATDPVTSPRGKWGKTVYGLLIGASVVIIREFTIFPGGTMFAILLFNPLVPVFNWIEKGRGLSRLNPLRRPLTILITALFVGLNIFALFGGELDPARFVYIVEEPEPVFVEDVTREKLTTYGDRDLPIYRALDAEGEFSHYEFEAVGPGFVGEAKVRVRIAPDLQELGGIDILESGATGEWEQRVTEYVEEPDNWEEYAFKNWFVGLNPHPEIELLEEGPVEQDNQVVTATGATISSRGIVQAINEALPEVKDKLTER